MKKNAYFYEIKEIYEEKKEEIEKRLNDFSDIWKKGNK